MSIPFQILSSTLSVTITPSNFLFFLLINTFYNNLNRILLLIHSKLLHVLTKMFVEMFQLLFTIVSIEAVLILTLGFGTPARRVVVKLLDLSKQGRAPLVAKTVAATMLVLFGSVMFSTIQIHTRVSDSGGVANSTDQVMFANCLLEAFLMGK